MSPRLESRDILVIVALVLAAVSLIVALLMYLNILSFRGYYPQFGPWMGRYGYPSGPMGPMGGYPMGYPSWQIPSEEPTRVYSPRRFETNGEMIFYTGFNQDGTKVPFKYGPHWLYMHGGGCAACHGEDGRGEIYPMMCWKETPDIRYSELIEEFGSEEAIIGAIRDGVGHDGEELDYCMPRWELSDRDMRDLLEFLKKLG